MKKGLIFLAIFLPIVYFLFFSLTRGPRDLPSVLVGKAAPPFTLNTLDGGTYSLAESRGRPVVINFWATWCDACTYEHQLIKEMAAHYSSKGIDFIAILYEDSPANARRFIKRFGQAAPILLDESLKSSIDYGVSGIPETFFVTRDGIILYKQAGVLTATIFTEQLERLLKL